MQVAPLTTPNIAAAPGAAEEAGSRAEQFARVLQNAFFGSGSKAVARSAEPSAPEPAQRSETRSPEPRGTETRTTERSDTRASDSRDSAPQTSVQKKPAQQTGHGANKPAETAAPSTPAGQAEQAPESQSEEALADAASEAVPADQAAASEAEPDDLEAAAVDAASDAAAAGQTAASDLMLILSLLQGDAPVPPEVSQVVVTENPVLTTLLPVQPEGPVVEGQIPLIVAPAATQPAAEIAAPAIAADATSAEAPAVPVLPTASIPAALPEGAGETVVAPESAAPMVKTTETSAAALLAQQKAVTPEDFAAIQQALMMQGQAKPAANAATQASPAEGKVSDGKGLVVEVQPAPSNAASKTLVDQSALLAMQSEGGVAQETALPQPQPQVQAQAQPLTADAKFAAALQAQAEPAAPQANAAAALPNNPPHIAQQASSNANPGTPAPQAAQQAASQAAARQLGTYIPAGEQVAVQIKKGAAEGLDKISIRLDPGGLGKVEVKMEVGHDGRLMAVIAADKPETLAMLQRDAQSLEQSLRDAGLKTSSDSLSFTLRDQNQAADGREGREGQAGQGRNRGRGHDEYAGTGTTTDPAALAAANAQRVASARGGLDIRI